MKWPPMKLRTRLFLSISALVTVALLGLLLGLVSVLQMATMQQQLVRDTTHSLEVGLKLRQNLGEQLNLILDDDTAPENLRSLQDNFQSLLAKGWSKAASAPVSAKPTATIKPSSRLTATARPLPAAWVWTSRWALHSIRSAPT